MAAHRLIPLIVAAALAAGCAGANVHTDSFATMREARERGAVEHGWVPSWLPDGAYELRAAYEPDGSRRWGILNFRNDEAALLRDALRDEEISLSGTRIDIPARVEWWPIALRKELDPGQISATGLRAYRARSGDFIVAVNWSQGRAYYWSAPAGQAQ